LEPPLGHEFGETLVREDTEVTEYEGEFRVYAGRGARGVVVLEL